MTMVGREGGGLQGATTVAVEEEVSHEWFDLLPWGFNWVRGKTEPINSPK